MTPKDIKYKIHLLDNPLEECDKMIVENSLQFEHKITYIGAGAIAAILIFAEKHHHYPYLLIAGMFVLLLACMVNLYSYVWFNNLLRKDSDLFYQLKCGLKYLENNNISDTYYRNHKDIIKKSNADFHKYIVEKIDIRCKKADMYNKVNIYILFIGFLLTTIYVTLNLI